MDVDKLLIIAHPDDEVLWGGINLHMEKFIQDTIFII